MFCAYCGSVEIRVAYVGRGEDAVHCAKCGAFFLVSEIDEKQFDKIWGNDW